jgi:hypothetical protein
MKDPLIIVMDGGVIRDIMCADPTEDRPIVIIDLDEGETNAQVPIAGRPRDAWVNAMDAADPYVDPSLARFARKFCEGAF